jgi:hypothetical protein
MAVAQKRKSTQGRAINVMYPLGLARGPRRRRQGAKRERERVGVQGGLVEDHRAKRSKGSDSGSSGFHTKTTWAVVRLSYTPRILVELGCFDTSMAVDIDSEDGDYRIHLNLDGPIRREP